VTNLKSIKKGHPFAPITVWLTPVFELKSEFYIRTEKDEEDAPSISIRDPLS
jgi:hypothetical protein